MSIVARLNWLLSLEAEERAVVLSLLTQAEQQELRWHWELWARPEQLAPQCDWRVWLICAGRGFGKTRAGAEWVRTVVRRNPEARIALVGSSLTETRAVMVEGESGILSISPPHRRPVFEPSLRRLTWPTGAQAFLYSAAEPESLRGPQHSHAWCDEIAKWDMSSGRASAAWDNLAFGLRLGECPQVLATTTPRAVPLLKRLLSAEKIGDTVVTRGTSYDNAGNLPARFLSDIRAAFGRSALGRQELDGEMLEDVEGALWSRDVLERCREPAGRALTRIVVGVDPPASAKGDACGIVVVGLGDDGIARVLADCSVTKPSPERWARAAAGAARLWNADRIVAEANQGGAMVESVMRAADVSLPIRLVHASRGKVARAEPIAALYEAGRVRHQGHFAELEDEMCALGAGGQYHGPGRSPDRADALVWALTELMLGTGGRPRIWVQ
ncbi:terminase family protein [Croceicoccus sp. F390]|uniref:Terminase family protein n=1 Tax=Croceicoccus esteveae TaxID=3075597 RepID=A0ABU2ZIT8_9SPHN|nr:terminase family protein [Croceicoccus sp. F390]MDT0576522.1 terminase family protein [Croceicoccus sp. F390]